MFMTNMAYFSNLESTHIVTPLMVKNIRWVPDFMLAGTTLSFAKLSKETGNLINHGVTVDAEFVHPMDTCPL